MTVFLGEISTWISRLSKADCPPWSRWASSKSFESLNRTESWVRGSSLSACLQAGESVSSCLRTQGQAGIYTMGSPGSHAFRFRWELIPTALDLQLTHCSSWDLTSIRNCISQFFTHTHTHTRTQACICTHTYLYTNTYICICVCIRICILLVLFPWGAQTTTVSWRTLHAHSCLILTTIFSRGKGRTLEVSICLGHHDKMPQARRSKQQKAILHSSAQ